MPTHPNGITHIYSSRSVSDLLARLLSLLEVRGITVFAVIDHSGEAIKAGIEMHATKLVIFGSPKAGTPLMLAAPDCALDLPLKKLIAETADGTTRKLQQSCIHTKRYGLTLDLANKVAAVEQLAAAIVA